MTLSRSTVLHFILAAVATVWLSSARADEPKPTPALPLVPALPDKSKDKPLPDVFDKANPDSIDDLKAIEKHVKSILEKVIPCTVSLQVGQSSGSGVIISADGLILTAAHVSAEPNKDIFIIMPDGKRLKGKSLGGNVGIDSGMVKIVEEGKYPFVEMGKSGDMKKNSWCLTTGHPGGFRPGRTPVVRVGRILDNTASLIRTDCTLVGGDSGGPLFDMYGRVIGIHSRIGPTITANIHVPVDTYRETWDRLVKGERWGGRTFGIGPRNQGDPYFGFKLDQVDKDCKIIEVVKDSPAEKAGLKTDDVIRKFDGKEIENVDALRDLIKKKKPGDEVALEIQRGKETVKLKVIVGKLGA